MQVDQTHVDTILLVVLLVPVHVSDDRQCQASKLDDQTCSWSTIEEINVMLVTGAQKWKICCENVEKMLRNFVEKL